MNSNANPKVITALITPFLPTGEVDWNAFDRLLKYQLSNGSTGVVLCGTTAETPTLSDPEKRQIIERGLQICRATNKQFQVIAGTGSACTATTIEFSKWASNLKCDAVLVVTPYYNRPTAAGLKAHYLAVADSIQCPLYLYNVPTRTGVTLSAQTVVELANHANICGIKEAGGDAQYVTSLRDLLPDPLKSKFEILCGDDALFYSMLTLGASGIISVSSHLIAKQLMQIAVHLKHGEMQSALAIHERLLPLNKALFIESNPAPLKMALSLLPKTHSSYLASGALRLPLVPVQAPTQQKLSTVLNSIQELIA